MRSGSNEGSAGREPTDDLYLAPSCLHVHDLYHGPLHLIIGTRAHLPHQELGNPPELNHTFTLSLHISCGSAAILFTTETGPEEHGKTIR